METTTIRKYTKILNDRRTLKCDIKDAIEVLNSSEEFKKYKSQSSSSILDTLSKYSDRIKDKIIIKKYSIKSTNKEIIYWACCNINDFITVAGFEDFSNGVYNSVNIDKKNRISFLGKDIIKALNEMGDIDNDFLKKMKENYVDSEHHIADKIFYYISFNFKAQKFNCVRDIDLSPRPININKD